MALDRLEQRRALVKRRGEKAVALDRLEQRRALVKRRGENSVALDRLEQRHGLVKSPGEKVVALDKLEQRRALVKHPGEKVVALDKLEQRRALVKRRVMFSFRVSILSSSIRAVNLFFCSSSPVSGAAAAPNELLRRRIDLYTASRMRSCASHARVRYMTKKPTIPRSTPVRYARSRPGTNGTR